MGSKDDPWGRRSMGARDAVALLTSIRDKATVLSVFKQLGSADVLSPAQRGELAAELFAKVGPEGYTQMLLLPFLKPASNERAGVAPWLQVLPMKAQGEVLSEVKSIVPRIANSLTAPPIRNELKRDVDTAVIDTIKTHQVTFFTDDHSMDDESYFSRLAQQMADAGVKHLALELGPNEFKAEVDRFLKSGETTDLGDKKDLVVVTSMMKFAKALHDKGIGVDLVDMSRSDLVKALGAEKTRMAFVAVAAQLSHQPVPPETIPAFLEFVKVRDEHMAKEIKRLSNDGKVVAWLGAVHSIKDAKPYPSARELVDRAGISAATIKLEWPHVEGDDERCEMGRNLALARSEYFCTQPFGPSFAYPASAVGDLAMMDITSAEFDTPNFNLTGPFVPYKTGADLLLFMSAEDCPRHPGDYWEPQKPGQ